MSATTVRLVDKVVVDEEEEEEDEGEDEGLVVTGLGETSMQRCWCR